MYETQQDTIQEKILILLIIHTYIIHTGASLYGTCAINNNVWDIHNRTHTIQEEILILHKTSTIINWRQCVLYKSLQMYFKLHSRIGLEHYFHFGAKKCLIFMKTSKLSRDQVKM